MKLELVAAGVLLAGIALAAPRFPTIHSSTPLAFDSLVALGFENNPNLRRTADDTRLNAIGKLAAVGNFLPRVSVGMSFSQTHYRNPTFVNPDGSISTYPVSYTDYAVIWQDTSADGSLGNPRLASRSYTIDVPEGDSRSSQMYLSVDETLFEGGRRLFLYRMAKIQEQINDLNLVDARKNLTLRIAQQVVIVLTQEKLLDLTERLRDQRKDAYDLAKARFDVGAVTELDVLQAEIELGSAENAITSAERQLQAEREALNQLLGIDLKSMFPVAELPDVTPYQYDVDSLVTEARRLRTDLQLAELTAQRAGHSVNLNRADYLPTVTLGGQWSRSQQSGKYENWTFDPRNENSSFYLNLRWNLFDGFNREYNIATQRIARDKAEESVRELQLGVDKAVRDAFYNLEKVHLQLQITGRNRELADRTLNLERERYRLGATSQLALRDAQVTYARAESEHLQKTLEYQSSLIALELAVGRPIR